VKAIEVKILDKKYEIFGYPEEFWFEFLKEEGEYFEQNGFDLSSLRELIKPNMVCLDIGASYGLFTLAMSQLAKKVIAFEPDWHAIQNTVMGIQNVELYKWIIGKQDCYGDFIVDEKFRTSNHFIPNPKGHAFCSTIDSLELEQVDFVKIDAEGSEVDILEGMRSTLQRCKPLVLLEFNPYAFITYRNLTPRDALYDIMQFFTKVGYYQDNQLIPITDPEEFLGLLQEETNFHKQVKDLLCEV
jgi:FkbM family methyltransferase